MKLSFGGSEVSECTKIRLSLREAVPELLRSLMQIWLSGKLAFAFVLKRVLVLHTKSLGP